MSPYEMWQNRLLASLSLFHILHCVWLFPQLLAFSFDVFPFIRAWTLKIKFSAFKKN